MSPIGKRHDHRLAVDSGDLHLINHERVIGHDGFIARRQERPGQQPKDLVRPIAQNDLVTPHFPTISKGLPKLIGPTVRISMQHILRTGQRGQGFR